MNNPKEAILKALADESDQKDKRLLLLMLSMIEDISSKLDAVLANEERIKTIALNGHAPVHHDDHEWIGRRRKTDERDLRILAWAEEAMLHDEENRKRCVWVDRKMKTDEYDEKSRRDLRDRWLERAAWGLTVLAVWGLANGLSIKAALS